MWQTNSDVRRTVLRDPSTPSETLVRALMTSDGHRPEGEEAELNIVLKLYLFVDVIPVHFRPSYIAISLIVSTREKKTAALLAPILISLHSTSGPLCLCLADLWSSHS